MLRAIVAFPQFDKDPEVDAIRRQYDSLYSYIPHHLTLVFPFESSINVTVLNDHAVSKTFQIPPFTISLGTPVRDEDYVYLPLVEGVKAAKSLHRLLYSDVLGEFHSSRQYVPHVTVGRGLKNQSMISACMAEAGDIIGAKGYIDTVVCEIIGNDETSTVEFEVRLRQ
jgi:2'-5' RNA ligase